MSLKWKKIELSNIRSHKHMVFEPRESGTTAISGATGAGKSTIVDSVAWALFGTKPAGVSKTSAIFRADATWGKDKCFVNVWIEVDGRNIRVERKMINKVGAVEARVFETIDGKEKHIAGPAVSHAEPFLRHLLGMDERGFLSAVLVQQKQVDYLISAKSSERAQVIEDMTGISAITSALKNAREEYNGLKKAVSMSNVDDTALEKDKKEREALVQEVETLTVQRAEAISKGETITAERDKLQAEYDQKSALVEKGRELNNNLLTVSARIESMTADLEATKAERDAKKAVVASLSAGAGFDKIDADRKENRRQLSAAQALASDASRRLNALNESIQSQKDIIATAEFSDRESANAELVNLRSERDERQTRITTAQEGITSAKSDMTKVKKAIKTLVDGHGHCPTCLQTVEDISVVTSALEAQVSAATAAIETHNEAIKQLSGELETISARGNLVRSAVEAFDFLEKNEPLVSGIRTELAEADASVKMAEKMSASIDRAYQEAVKHRSLNAELARLSERVHHLVISLNTAAGEKNDIEEQLKGLGIPSDTAVARIRKKLDEVIDKREEATRNYLNINSKVKVNQSRIAGLDRAISMGEESVERHRKLIHAAEVASSTSETIAEFREERIKSSVPTLEAYASELLNRFTEGRFTRLSIDHKFNTKVSTANGTERPVGLLSGGELSAAAMALRLAISMLLSGGQSSDNLIILDEVLVSQDAMRAEAILEGIKEVCQGQVVIISHNDSVDDIADAVFKVADPVF